MDTQTVNPAEKAAREAYEKVETALKAYLTDEMVGSTILADAMRYALLDGTVRFRASLVLGFCRLFGGRDEAALPYACALECAAAASLIHGDLPAVNDMELRGGRPTCVTKFGEAETIFAGDSLTALAFEIAASNQYVSHKSVRLAVSTLSKEIGALGLTGSYITERYGTLSGYGDLRKFYLRKSATLIRAACLLGYYAATDKTTPKDIANVKLYAEAVALAAQIHDDILGTDSTGGRTNVLTYLKPNEAEEEEALLTLLAIEAISDYPGSELLCKQAIWLLSRQK